MSQSRAVAPVSPSSDTRGPAVVASVIALVLGVLELLGAGAIWYLTATDPSDDPLVSLGYLVAIVVGAPGVVGVVLGGLGWRFADRVAGLVLSILGVLAAAGPVAMVLTFAFPSL
ncbi:MAG: hypothetical protein NTX33_17465 [Propionibacteriales bacterium]|nr:hypothetical protein [Propionibacteriales bacterium]